MITKELFIKMIKSVENFDKELNRWHDFGIEVFEMPIGTIPWEMFNIWTETCFNEEGIDWINWYLFDRISIFNKEVLPYYDENDNPHYVNTVEDLWDLVKEYRLNNCTLKSEKCNI